MIDDWTEYTRFTISLLAILTPFAAVPIFLSLTDGWAEAEKRRTAFVAALTVFLVLAVSAVGGDMLLKVMGTSLDAFRVGGGLVLLLMALSMLSAKVSPVQQTKEEAVEAQGRNAIGVVPLGLPLMAGPGAISSTIIQMGRTDGVTHAALVMGCIVLVCVAVWGLLRMAAPIGRKLGVTGLNILNRLFGLLLAAIAVQIMAMGLKGLFPALA